MHMTRSAKKAEQDRGSAYSSDDGDRSFDKLFKLDEYKFKNKDV